MRVAATFILFCLTTVIFRGSSLGTSLSMLQKLFVPQPGLGAPLHGSGFVLTLAAVAVAHWLGWGGQWKKMVAELPVPALGAGYAMLFMLALLLAPSTGQAFIYFQF